MDLQGFGLRHARISPCETPTCGAMSGASSAKATTSKPAAAIIPARLAPMSPRKGRPGDLTCRSPTNARPGAHKDHSTDPVTPPMSPKGSPTRSPKGATQPKGSPKGSPKSSSKSAARPRGRLRGHLKGHLRRITIKSSGARPVRRSSHGTTWVANLWVLQMQTLLSL